MSYLLKVNTKEISVFSFYRELTSCTCFTFELQMLILFFFSRFSFPILHTNRKKEKLGEEMKRFINEVFGSTKDRNSHQWCLGLKLEVTKFGIKNSILKSLLKKTLATFAPGPLPINSSVKLPHKYITVTLFKGMS